MSNADKESAREAKENAGVDAERKSDTVEVILVDQSGNTDRPVNHASLTIGPNCLRLRGSKGESRGFFASKKGDGT